MTRILYMLRSNIRKLIKKIKIIKEFIIIISFFSPYLISVFSMADIELSTLRDSIALPQSIIKISKELVRSDSLYSKYEPLLSTIINNNDVLIVNIKNKSMKYQNIDELNIPGYSEDAIVGLESDSVLVMQKAESIVEYSFLSDKISFTNINEIPPNSEIKLFIWGEYISPLLNNRATIVTEATYKYSEGQTVYGLASVVANNFTIIVIITILLSLIYGLKRKKS